MLRKSIWAVVIIVVLLAAAAGGYWVYQSKYSPESVALSQLPSIIVGGKNPDPGTVSQLPPQPAIPTGLVTVTAVTPSSITIQTNDKQTRAFTVTNTTDVYSVAFAGEKGKSYSDISVGTTVNVYPSKTDPAVAAAIAFKRDPSLIPTADENTHTVIGTVTKLSSTEVTVTPTNTASSTVTIALSPSTKIITSVFAGQKGRTMAVGDIVAASGLVTAGGKTTATLILLSAKR